MYNRILIPLDGSSFAECALTHARAIAAGCHIAEVVLLNVTAEVYPAAQWISSQQRAIQLADDTEKARHDIQDTAVAYMKKVSGDLQKSGLNVKTEIIEASGTQHPAEIILDYAEKNHVDLIILTTHGRSGISRWAFGSQADKIVTRSKVPVLTITPSGCRAG